MPTGPRSVKEVPGVGIRLLPVPMHRRCSVDIVQSITDDLDYCTKYVRGLLRSTIITTTSALSTATSGWRHLTFGRAFIYCQLAPAKAAATW